MTRRLDWAAIFRRRPDLSPPGYTETVEAMRNPRPERAPEPRPAGDLPNYRWEDGS